MANLARLLTDTAATHGGRTAIKLDDATMSYAELDGASAMLARVLVDEGLEVGDRVGLMMPNVPHFAVIFYAVLRAGGVVVPMNPLLSGREVAFYLGDNGAGRVFAWHGFADAARAGADEAGAECSIVEATTLHEMTADVAPLAEVVEQADDDTAVILYTSGTTGTPKGAELTHANLRSNTEASAHLFGVDSEDVIFGGLPLFHVFGLTCGLNTAVSVGAMITLVPRFEPGKVMEVLARDDVTLFEGVPTMYVALNAAAAKAEPDLPKLRLCASGGAALPVEVLHSFEDLFGVKILEGYGLSETSPVASFNHPDRERKAGSIGQPIEGVQMRLVADGEVIADDDHESIGEIEIKGPNVMKGYWERPDDTDDAIVDEWFRSGDLAQRDEDGFYFIVDRKKDMIIRGGYNVYPREVEEVLYEHDAVEEAAVLGIPHDEMGEEVAAAVVLKDGAEATADDIKAFVKEQVAAYKYPRHVWIVDELPKTATGKIQKREISVPESATG